MKRIISILSLLTITLFSVFAIGGEKSNRKPIDLSKSQGFYSREKDETNKIIETGTFNIVNFVESEDTASSVYTGAISAVTNPSYVNEDNTNDKEGKSSISRKRTLVRTEDMIGYEFGWLLSTYNADITSSILFLRIALHSSSSTYREVNSNSKLIIKLSDGEILTLQTRHGTHYKSTESHEFKSMESRYTYSLYPISMEQLKKIVDKGIIKYRIQEVNGVYDGDICSKKFIDGKRTINEDYDFLDWNTNLLSLINNLIKDQIKTSNKINTLEGF